MTDTDITKSVILAAPQETVWAYLTEREKLGDWFFLAAADLESGKEYELVEPNEDGTSKRMVWGKVLEMMPPEKLVYTFSFEPLKGTMTTVTWELQKVHDGTKLSLTHSGIEAAAGEAAMNLLLALDTGWARHMAKLQAVF